MALSTTPHTRGAPSAALSIQDVAGRSYRGRCKYKSGRCPHERTLKYNGEVHTLCEGHRQRHNQIQSKSDTKIRRFKRLLSLVDQDTASLEWSGAKSSCRHSAPTQADVDNHMPPHLISPTSSSMFPWLESLVDPEIHIGTTPATTTPHDDEWTSEDSFIFTNLMGVTKKTPPSPRRGVNSLICL